MVACFICKKISKKNNTEAIKFKEMSVNDSKKYEFSIKLD